MGKGVEKHPCLACGFLKVSSSGSMKCAHPDITQSESYKYGNPFTCRCTPKWCPKHPDRSYLGEKVKAPEGERRETKQENEVIYAETRGEFEKREAGPDMGTPVRVKPEGVTVSDPVNHPDHYTDGGIETITILQAKLSEEEFRGYCRGNAIKYLSRAGKKTPDPKQDYEKAQWYLNKLVEVTE